MNEEQEIRGQEVDEEQFFGSRLPLYDVPYWCPLDEEVKIREDRIPMDGEPLCPICGQEIEPL